MAVVAVVDGGWGARGGGAASQRHVPSLPLPPLLLPVRVPRQLLLLHLLVAREGWWLLQQGLQLQGTGTHAGQGCSAGGSVGVGAREGGCCGQAGGAATDRHTAPSTVQLLLLPLLLLT